MRITDGYRKLNAALHESNAAYGTVGARWAGEIAQLFQAAQAQTILDYGCGKGTLKKALPHLPIIEYDPCIEGKDADPLPADLVVCTDVLEHIEPDCIDDVLDHLKALTNVCLFIEVATVPAKKFLADGRNAHVLLRPIRWWMDKLQDRFDLHQFLDRGGAFIATLKAKDYATREMAA